MLRESEARILSLSSRQPPTFKKMRTGLALGSNIEPRLLYLHAARRRIFDIHSGTEPIICSKVYETSPVACAPDALNFLNATLEFSTELQPKALFRELKDIEQALGRSPTQERNSPRTIDIDVLYCDDIVLSTPGLVIPHPRIASRRFVLQPLADIRPKLVLPTMTKSIRELLDELESDEIVTRYCDVIY
jgi:2-amino-4-hydroxy-6-hydroxymethyldihydropteridine diphosphokinase